MPLDRSGIRIEKRFTFYDQVHTTGMDIKQALNATAVVTLGKDMTLRDYSQGCWRMRGLGKGQRIHMMVVKEVSELIQKNAQTMTTTMTTHSGHEARTPLVHAVAWLITNSMRSEMLQYLQLQMQMVTNLWRKSAFRSLMTSTRPRQQDPTSAAMLTTRFHPKVLSEDTLQAALKDIPSMLKEDALDKDDMTALQLDYQLLQTWYMTFLGALQQRLNPRVPGMIAQMLPPRMLRGKRKKMVVAVVAMVEMVEYF